MKDNREVQLEPPERLLTEMEHCDQDVPSAWWEHVPGGKTIKEYFSSTSLHGLQYFSEPGRPLIERFYWLIAMVVVYVGVIISLYDQTMLFYNSPVLMSLDSTSTPIWDIPFPAVTICSENQVKPSTFNYSLYKTITNMTREDKEIFDYLTLTCKYNPTASGSEFLSSDALDYIHHGIWNDCSETIDIMWMSDYLENVCSHLQPILTSSGACHTFNNLPVDQLFRSPDPNQQIKPSDSDIIWTPDAGYKSKEASKKPPWRTRGRGQGQGATFMLKLNIEDFDETCSFGGHGFLVTLHSPAELPTLSHPTTYVHTDHFTNIMVIPEIKTTNKELRKWDPKKRGCFFEDERPLKYFQYYTEKNCNLECESNSSLTHCGCVPLFHPRTNGTPICGPVKFGCYIESIAKSVEPDTIEYHDCNCLPSCSEIEYRITVSDFLRDYSKVTEKGFQSGLFSGKFLKNNFASVTVQYQTQKVSAQMRVAVFSFTDFLANIGGLMGLFLGFSFLSLFEIVYFFILRFEKKRPNRRSAI